MIKKLLKIADNFKNFTNKLEFEIIEILPISLYMVII